jgi:hypothetical protein
MSVDDDSKLLRALARASRRIDKWCHRRFYPRLETRDNDYQMRSRVHYPDDDLLSLTSLSVDDTEISSDDYYIYPHDGYPKWKIEMDRGGGEIFTFSDTPQKVVAMTGVWGWHDDYDNAWPDSQDTVQDSGSITATVTTVTVSDVDGADIDGITPRFSAGMLIKIDSEYMAVTDTSEHSNELTVRRGVNGTTAATHDNGATIYVYRPADLIVDATLELAKYFYERRNATAGIVALPSLEGGAIRASAKAILMDADLPVRPPNPIRESGYGN